MGLVALACLAASSCAVDDEDSYEDACHYLCYASFVGSHEQYLQPHCNHNFSGEEDCRQYAIESCQRYEGLHAFKYVTGNCACWEEYAEGHGDVCELGDWPPPPDACFYACSDGGVVRCSGEGNWDESRCHQRAVEWCGFDDNRVISRYAEGCNCPGWGEDECVLTDWPPSMSPPSP